MLRYARPRARVGLAALLAGARARFPSRLLTMYQAHFGLRELPFGITPDTSFAFSGTSHQEALNTLLVAASSGEGFTKITGEVGTGKTMLCRRFMAALDGGYVCAYLPNPLLEPKGLMHALAHELHLRVKARADLQAAIQQLGKSLLELRRGRQARAGVHRRGPGPAARHAGGAAPADQSRNGQAQAAAGVPVRPAGARRRCWHRIRCASCASASPSSTGCRG